LTSPSVVEFSALSAKQRHNYLFARQIVMAPLGGFVYLLFNPRFTWIKGSIELLLHLVKSKLAQPHISFAAHAKTFKTRYWQSSQQYWHMFWNNVVLLSLWPLMCWSVGTGLFFAVYVISVSLAGGGGIMLFTVQHNFEHAYASDTKSWDYDQSAIEGTSFLVLPRWLNWFTANIGYHHIHHLSAKIPNYRLAKCHDEYQHLFVKVRRIKLIEIPYALTCLIWDAAAQRIISVAEFQQQQRT
jgi:omega-6 fatty acid desaturase (delta-12 desaturase)